MNYKPLIKAKLKHLRFSMSFYKTLLILLFLLKISVLTAQEEPINILPPSIDNYNFTKYGGLEMGNNNGGFSYSVPLHNIKYGGMNVPISLSYYTDGVKVNDIAGIAGMNWNLMAGGMITRVVKDRPDEDLSTEKFRPDTEYIKHIVDGGYTDAYYLANIKEDAMKLWNTTYNSKGSKFFNWLDTEQDAFSFNFNGHSGTFYIDDNQIYLDSDENGIKATFEVVVDGFTRSLKFTFITAEGIKYTFGGSPDFVESSEITSNCSRNYEEPIPTAWVLKQIEFQNQFVNFSYTNIFKHYPYDYSQSVTYRFSEDHYRCPDPRTISNCTSYFRSTNTKVLSQIDFGTSKIKLNYLTQREDYYDGYLLDELIVTNGFEDVDKINLKYLYSSSKSFNVPNPNTKVNDKRAFLEKIIFKNNGTQEFEYNNIDGLSPRLSYSQDFYGYTNENFFNSLLNVTANGSKMNEIFALMINKFPGLIDKADRSTDTQKSLYGVLTKIIYPTKGYSKIAYENNLNLENLETEKSESKYIELSKTSCQGFNNEPVESHQFTFIGNDTSISLSAHALVDRCEGVTIDDIHDRHGLTIKDLTEGEILYSLVIDADEEFISNETIFPSRYPTDYQGFQRIFLPIKTKKGHLYEVTYSVMTKFNDIRGSLAISYNKYNVRVPTVVNYSGARVLSITDYDANDDMYNYKKYVYNDVSDLISGKTSLHHNYPQHPSWTISCTAPTCFLENGINTRVDCDNVWTFGSSNYSLAFNTRGNRINYNTISTILANKNVIENKFLVNDTDNDRPINVHRKYLQTTPYSNTDAWYDGKLEETTLYENQAGAYVPRKITKNKYEIIDSKKFHNYNTELGISNEQGFMHMELNQVFNRVEPEFVVEGTIGRCTTLICYIREQLSVEKYYNYCRIRAKTQTTEIDFIGNKEIINITNYKYNTTYPYLISSESTTNSVGDVTKNEYYYATDATMVSQPFVNQLKDKNIYSPALKKVTLKNDNKISEQLTVYDNSILTGNLLLPKFIYGAKFPGTGNLEKKITYDQYDDKGNILQYTLEGGTPVSIIWGYNKTQPIAKIENVKYSTIPESTITNLQRLSNEDSDNCLGDNCTEELLRKGLAVLRNTFDDAFISTYTYNPLIGVTSITDPKGFSSYYEYDLSNKLKFIKDKDLNILQKYCYNFKGQQIDCSDNTSTTIVLYKSIARSGSFTKNNCASGGIGSSVAYNQVAGVSTSTISQADADAIGLTKFNTDGQANANAKGDCTFKSIARSGSFTKNNCASGGIGSSVAYNQIAGVITSKISQADADAIGLTKFNTDGQANVNAKGYCTFSSIARSGSFTKNNCAVGGVGSSVAYNQVAGVSTSRISQGDADAIGLAKFNVDGQNNANASGSCTFSSIVRSGSFTKNNCAVGGVASSVAYNQVAGVSTSKTSQADADAIGLAKFNVDGQANANAKGDCTFSSIARSGSFTKNNCASGGIGSSVAYNQVAGASTSKTSQADADAIGLAKFNVDGQANANAKGDCTFKSIARSSSFTKNNCAVGGVGSSVAYNQVAGVSTSKTSQADADAIGLAKFNVDGQANANTNGYCTFSSIARSGSFTKNNCAVGGVASVVTYYQVAGVSTSRISQADADAIGLAKFNVDGQANANTNGSCTFKSIARSGSFTKNNCGIGGGTGTNVAYSQPAGSSTSIVSQADADSKGLLQFNKDGQANANTNGNCVFYNKSKSGSFIKNNCGLGTEPVGPTLFVVPDNSVISYESQAEADSFAQQIVNSQGQSYANTNGTCKQIYFDAQGVYEILLKKMFITLTASSANHNGRTYNIEIVYDTAQNFTNYLTVQLSLLPGETEKTLTVPVRALTHARISFNHIP
ncbi:DUF5977 domain-containing protein [Flavobacterium sp. EDS]|uniref:DUF5977 domain-containing protein n=1 Tax=Flavobacterium sp. EDS TaxID=2897328 RepID=UPI001E4CD474|nr:DUF5977 domain-containing protein [Flavobacterium sp. EDS]MCD0476768.1 DUF5977 domain-containing protein [Flavobacterium sp. EDS]